LDASNRPNRHLKEALNAPEDIDVPVVRRPGRRGPDQKFTSAISLMVFCETQQEIDDLWRSLTAGGGEPGVCGWLTDRFGLSWQIVPATLTDLLREDGDGAGDRVMKAVMGMTKLDIAALQDARKEKARAAL
jgi:predicted 3-demethylubiquinone-9 3-methyltransferase (glyoxalase superfamily)